MIINFKNKKYIVGLISLFLLANPISILAADSQPYSSSGDSTPWILLSVFGFSFIWIFLIGIIMIINILGIALWIWMLIDCVKRDFKKENDKILWILVIVLAGWIGALIYYFMIKRKEEEK